MKKNHIGLTCAVGIMLTLATGLPVDAKAVTVRWCTWLGGSALAALQEQVKIFEKSHPNIKVKIEVSSYDGLKQKLFLQYAAGTAPDVFHSTVNMADEFIRRGMLEDVTALVKSTMNLKDYIPLSKSYFKGAKIWGGFETHNQVYPTFYNIDLFNRAGINTPDKFAKQNKWDWVTFREVGTKLTKDNNGDGRPDQWGTFVQSWWGNTEPHWGQWVASNNATWINANRTKILLTTPEVRDAIKDYYNLGLEYKAASLTGVGFETGKLGMLVTGTWGMQNYETVKKLNWDITYPPKGPRASHYISCVSPGADAIVSSQTKHPKEAWEFVKFLLSKNCQMLKAQDRLTVPVLKEALYSKEFNRSKNTEVIQSLLENPPDWELEVFEGFDDVNKQIDAQFQKVLQRKMSIDAAIETAQKEAQKVLDRINKERRKDRK